MPVLNHRHPYFDHFMNTLAGPLGCNFQWVPDSTSASGRRRTWDCGGRGDTSRAQAIITRMNDTVLRDDPVDIRATLAYLAGYGGVCDCEIVLSVPIIPNTPE